MHKEKGNNLLYREAHMRASTDTRERERERQTDGKRERRLMEHAIVVRCIMIIVWPASKGEGWLCSHKHSHEHTHTHTQKHARMHVAVPPEKRRLTEQLAQNVSFFFLLFFFFGWKLQLSCVFLLLVFFFFLRFVIKLIITWSAQNVQMWKQLSNLIILIIGSNNAISLSLNLYAEAAQFKMDQLLLLGLLLLAYHRNFPTWTFRRREEQWKT